MPIHPGSVSSPASAAPPDGRVSGECDRCGYSLVGLSGTRCPECGASIAAPGREEIWADSISELPPRKVRRFRHACWAGMVGMLGLMAAFWAALFTPPGPGGDIVVLAGAGMWFVGAWLLTRAYPEPQAVVHGFGAGSVRRRLARALQTGWLLFAVGASSVAIGLPTAIATAMVFGGVIVGAAGLVAIALHLEDFALWTRDDTAERAFRLFAWGAPIMIVFNAVTEVWIPVLQIGVAALLFAGLTIMCVFALPYGLFSMSGSLAWAVHHAEERVEREARRLERKAAQQQEASARMQRADADTTDRRAPIPGSPAEAAFPPATLPPLGPSSSRDDTSGDIPLS